MHYIYLTGIVLIAWGVLSSLWVIFGVGYRLVNKSTSKNYFIRRKKIYYCLGGNFFNLGSSEMKSVDISSFVVMSSNFSKDKNHVYFRQSILLNANPKGFQCNEELKIKQNENGQWTMDNGLWTIDDA